MMISTKGRYALRVMLDLAKYGEDRYVSLKDIANRQEISLKYLEMIVALLNKGGLVISRRGKTGGYRLAKKPEEYPIGTILKLMEGTLAPVYCVEEGAQICKKADKCQTLPLWEKLDSIIEHYLSSVTLKDLLDGNV